MASTNITNVTLKTYDEAILNKFKERIPKKSHSDQPTMQVVYAPVDLAFEYAMKRKQIDSTVPTQNQISLPLLSLYRPSGFSLSDMTHQVLGHNKSIFYVRYKDKKDGAIKMRNIQRLFVDIPYQLDIWTDSEEIMAEVVQSILFFLMREQYLYINQLITDIYLDGSDSDESIGDVGYEFKMTLDSSINDNTSLESEGENGKLYRYTLVFMIEDAILLRDVSQSFVKTIDITSEFTGNSELSLNWKLELDDKHEEGD